MLKRKSIRTNIRIFGMEENENQNTVEKAVVILNWKLNLNFEKSDISKGFRIEKKNREQSEANHSGTAERTNEIPI